LPTPRRNPTLAPNGPAPAKRRLRAASAALLAFAALASLLPACNQVFGIGDTVPEQPDYYTCSCGCSRRVLAKTGAAVFSFAGGTFVGTALIGDQGAILDGPVTALANGQPAQWWQVRFDSGVSGWVTEPALTVANETLVTKAPNLCLPQPYNPYLGGTPNPGIDQLQALCAGDVSDASQTAIDQLLAPLGKFLCQCNAKSVALAYDASCTVACPAGQQVCLVAGFDPPAPAPAPLDTDLLQPTSECELSTADETVVLDVGGHQPKTPPVLQGSLQIRGRPCPAGAGCQVGLSYQLTSSDVEFDSGTVFADDPKFVDLGLVGATEPDVIALGPFLGFDLGGVPAGTALSSVRGRRSGSASAFSFTGRNAAGLALGVNWPARACRISGTLVGQAVGDGSEGTLDAQLDVGLNGVLTNQPPHPDAGPDQTVECTSTTGADVTLDASASSDADGNISFYEWRQGSATGPQLGAPSASPVAHTRQSLGHQTYSVLVVDGAFAADRASTGVTVADTTPPTIACNAPATIHPSDVPEKRGLPFTATATDQCTGVSSLAITGASCARPESCVLGVNGATLTVYDSGGIGDVITWTVAARDGAGNPSQTTCQVTVVRKK
jgi:hypothetical protein